MINRTLYTSSLDVNEKPEPNTDHIYGGCAWAFGEKKSKKTSKVLVLLISVYLYISAAKLPGKSAPSGEFLSPLDIDRS